MRSPTKQTSDRRAESGVRRTAAAADRAPVEAKRKAPLLHTATDEKPAKKEGVVTSMVDALEDILKWERASERALRIAAVTPGLDSAEADQGRVSTDVDSRSN